LKKFAAIIDGLMDRFIDKMMDRFMHELLEQGKPAQVKNTLDVYIPTFDVTLKLHRVDGERLLNAGVHPMLHGAPNNEMDDEEREAEANLYMRNARQLICECSISPKIYPHYHKVKGDELSISKFSDSMVLEILGLICPFDNSGFLRANRSSVDLMDADCLDEHYVRADNQDKIANDFQFMAQKTGIPLDRLMKKSNEELARIGEMINAVVDNENSNAAKGKG